MTDVINGGITQSHVQQIQLHEQQIQTHIKTIKHHEQYIGLLEEQLNLSKVQKFSASSEKLAYQIDLFNEVELEQAIADIDALLPDELLTEAAVAAKKTRKRGFSPSLTRVRVELTLTDVEKTGAARTFFTKVKEELEYIPAQLNVLEYWQEKALFSCVNGDDYIIAAQRPVHPLGKCFASTLLLTNIMVSKYADGLPFYRQESILKRYGHVVSRSNTVGWSMGSRMTAQLVCDALRMAIWQRRPKAGLIVHSGRGSQYARNAYRRLLKAHDFVGSMGR